MKGSSPGILLDSSVAVKWFIAEDDSNKAVALQERFLADEIELFMPDLALYEIANALLFAGLYTGEQIKTYMEALLELDVRIVPFGHPVLERAIELAHDRGVAVYDAYFAACAEKNGLTYLTADAKAVKKLVGMGFVKGF